MKQIGLLIPLLAFLVGCTSSRISDAIRTEVESKKSVDLSAVTSDDWERVCVLGPYSSDQVASETLGFSWPAEARSSIEENDGISLLLFVHGGDIAYAVEHPRDAGDFTNLSGRCFSREDAKFNLVLQPDGWPWLAPRDGA
jgi:hypothetical protein